MGIFSKKLEEEKPENFDGMLAKFRELKKDLAKISEELAQIKAKNKFSIQKVAIKRYNPFKEVGGDQSFSLAILDDNDNGAVITSHYTRQENRIYGKPLKAGKSDYPLSQEEEKVIEEAQKSNSK